MFGQVDSWGDEDLIGRVYESDVEGERSRSEISFGWMIRIKKDMHWKVFGRGGAKDEVFRSKVVITFVQGATG